MLGVTVAGLAVATGALLGHASPGWQVQSLPGYAKGNGQSYVLNGPAPGGDSGSPSSAGEGGATIGANAPPALLAHSRGRIVTITHGHVPSGFPLTSSVIVPTTYFVAQRGSHYVALYAGAKGTDPHQGLVVVWVSAPYGIGTGTMTQVRFPGEGAVILTRVSISNGTVTVRDAQGTIHSFTI
jgi:hypothetical protein